MLACHPPPAPWRALMAQRRNQITDEIKRIVEDYSKDEGAGRRGHEFDGTRLRALVREAEKAPPPRVKKDMLAEAKRVLQRATT